METLTKQALRNAIIPSAGKNGRPFVTLSYAQSLNGSITTKRKETLSLSNAQSLTITHQIRASHDAVLVGIETVLTDNPRLTVRRVSGENPQPIILDSRLRFPLDAQLMEHTDLLPWIATTQTAHHDRQQTLECAGARVLRFPSNDSGKVDLNALLSHLYGQGITSLMVEGGAQVISSFYQAQLIDRLIVTVTPLFFGGLNAIENSLESGIKDEIISAGKPIPRLKDLNHQQLGSDIILFGDVQWTHEWTTA